MTTFPTLRRDASAATSTLRNVLVRDFKDGQEIDQALLVRAVYERTKGSGERTWGSPQWIVFTGLSFEDSLGFGWIDAVHPADREATVAAWATARETGQYYVEHRFRRSSTGEYRWHQTRAKPIAYVDADEDDWVGTSTDVHEMRELQEDQRVLLAEVQHRTRNLLAVVQSLARQTMRRSTSPTR